MYIKLLAHYVFVIIGLVAAPIDALTQVKAAKEETAKEHENITPITK